MKTILFQCEAELADKDSVGEFSKDPRIKRGSVRASDPIEARDIFVALVFKENAITANVASAVRCPTVKVSWTDNATEAVQEAAYRNINYTEGNPEWEVA